ncbi:MAG: rhodanese-like domain-containing protein [Deltaproteobacteria bacterium]|nr:rhodanese-like domain-containing protein [Deltaproteobacteria bacterium]MBW2086599.1 rhodanese-like domain-containing protein [Deltaproteobacteria bacterium]
MKVKWFSTPALLVCLVVILGFAVPAAAQGAPKITKEQLKEMLDNPEVIVIDVRLEILWKASKFKIKGAVREKSGKAEKWAGKYDKTKTYVLYCA